MTNYEKLSRPPEWALKRIEAGRLRGKTDINPQWRYEAMEQVFGPCGEGWYYEPKDIRLEKGANDEVALFTTVAVYTKTPSGEWSKPVFGFGGSTFIAKESKGLYTDDEALKKAMTDALSVALKFLGVAADIYKGSWDGSKYISKGPAVVDDTVYENLKTAIIDYTNAGVLTGDLVARAKICIDNKDIEGMTRCVEYCKGKKTA